MRICLACSWFCSIRICTQEKKTAEINSSPLSLSFAFYLYIKLYFFVKKKKTFIWDMTSQSWLFDMPATWEANPSPDGGRFAAIIASPSPDAYSSNPMPYVPEGESRFDSGRVIKWDAQSAALGSSRSNPDPYHFDLSKSLNSLYKKINKRISPA